MEVLFFALVSSLFSLLREDKYSTDYLSTYLLSKPICKHYHLALIVCMSFFVLFADGSNITSLSAYRCIISLSTTLMHSVC